ncbi:MAG: PAS domain S-box protein, partial [Planctomycetia bacterium]|nr:PAS domain S-box protein [Planctomycetia bacterium]
QPATPAEAALREYKSLWETISRVSGEYVAVVDRAGTIIFCNRVGPGFTVDQVVGHHIARFTVPESSALLEKNIREVFETGEERSLETTVRLLDGGYDYFALRMGPVAIAGRTVAVLVCCESTRTLKMSEESLRHERHVLRRLIEVQERERQLVSYEIHDGLSQYLAGAMMHLQAFDHALRSTDGGRAAALAASGDLREGLRLVRAAVDESRRLIGGLRPPALDELGLVAAVESLVSEARADIRRVSFAHTLPCGRMPAHLETTIFRIVQESLSNVRKHAQARSAEVAIEQAPLPDGRCAVRVAVRDDGVGFDSADVPADRFGLEGIRQRCRLVGGEPSIQSRPGGGTTIEAVLPLPVATG